jgi:hypothetical protein
MLTLLLRNFLAAELEFHSAGQTANDPRVIAQQEETEKLMNLTRVISLVGSILSALGILLLLVEVWLILTGSPPSPNSPQILT